MYNKMVISSLALYDVALAFVLTMILFVNA